MSPTPTLLKRSQQRFVFLAWVGDRQEFDKLVVVCLEVVDDAKKRAMSAVDRSPEARTRALQEYKYLDTKAKQDQKWAVLLGREEGRAAAGIVLRMTARQRKFDQEFAGDPDDVLAAIDQSELKRVTLEMGSTFSALSLFQTSGYGLQLVFDVKDGVRVELSGPDSDWVILGTEKLKSALGTGRPWYWPALLQGLVMAAVAFPFSIAVGVSLLSSLDEYPSVIVLSVLASLTGIAIGFWATVAVKRALPAFELLEPGLKAKGSRVIGVLATTILWLAATIAIPFVFWRLGV